jgi:hypothetical protein
MGIQTDERVAQVEGLRRSIAEDRRAINEKWSKADTLMGGIAAVQRKSPPSRTNTVSRLSTTLAALVLPLVILGSLLKWTYGVVVFIALAFLIIEVAVSAVKSPTDDPSQRKPSQDWIL